MKARLIALNWLFAWLPLSYVGDDVVIGLCVGSWFCLSCFLMIKHERAVFDEVKKLDRRIIRLIRKYS